jgi:hypothetical protein
MTTPVDVKAIIYAENDQPDLPWGEQKLFPCQFVVAVGDAYNPGRRLRRESSSLVYCDPLEKLPNDGSG